MPSRNTPAEQKTIITEQFYSQVSESIKLVFDLTSRIDERVKMLVERQNALDERLDKFMEMQQEMQQEVFHRVTVLEEAKIPTQRDLKQLKESLHNLKNKIHALDLKMETVQLKTTHHDTRMNQIFDWVLKFLFMILGGYLLYKLGFNAPPTP